MRLLRKYKIDEFNEPIWIYIIVLAIHLAVLLIPIMFAALMIIKHRFEWITIAILIFMTVFLGKRTFDCAKEIYKIIKNRNIVYEIRCGNCINHQEIIYEENGQESPQTMNLCKQNKTQIFRSLDSDKPCSSRPSRILYAGLG